MSVCFLLLYLVPCGVVVGKWEGSEGEEEENGEGKMQANKD